MSLFVGTAGWSYPDWEGVVYPPKPGRAFRHLAYLARFFNCVEVNSTFYRPPTPALAAGWAEQVSDHPTFRFTLKLWQRFTHEHPHDGPPTDADLRTWKDGLAPLAASGRLAAVLWQFPWSFRNAEVNRRHLARLAQALPEAPAIVEVRHSSWNSPATLRFLGDLGLAFANIDQPALRDCIGPTAHRTSPRLAYVRLHGRNQADWFRQDAGRDARYDYYYSAAELDGWAERTRELLASTEAVFVIANNHYRGQAPANALQLKARLTEGGRVPVPADLLAHFQDLAAVAVPAPSDPAPSPEPPLPPTPKIA
ncbi:MAG: DUF72 domain-containing protein [Planctomycetes bacterium]|nr:DUF72 domain-containing protein [Planctomycetota bacterium]